DGTLGVASVAADAHVLLVRDAVDAVVPRGDHEADRAGVDVAKDMAADFEIAGTNIAARAAPNAAERVAEERVLAHGGATVVEEDEVELLRSVHADLGLELD